jgi:hypothetical protein
MLILNKLNNLFFLLFFFFQWFLTKMLKVSLNSNRKKLQKVFSDIFDCSCRKSNKKIDENDRKEINFVYFDDERLRKQSRLTNSEFEYQIDVKNELFRVNSDDKILEEPITFANIFGNFDDNRKNSNFYKNKRVSYCLNNNIEMLLENKKRIYEFEIIEINGIIII